MKNIKVFRKGSKTTVIYERKNKPVRVYYNDKLYAKMDINKKVKKDNSERNFIAGIIIFIAMVIGGSFFFEDTTAIKQVEAKEIVIEKIVKVKDDTVPPILKHIAECESGGKQFDKNGKVIRGKVNRNDIGKFQLSETVWGKTAKQKGFDIYTKKGNEQMAMYLFENYGSTPWIHSKSCWVKKMYQS